jgi:hypothetical protein
MKLTSLVALCALIFSITATQAQRHRDGDITLTDGRRTVRINIGDERFERGQLMRRIRRLEEAVRDLQDSVYDLQTNPTQEVKFTCRAVTCRQSTSIHSASASNCSFFNMYRPETITVWAESGSRAEKKATAKLEQDTDVKQIQSAVSCSISR